MSARDVSIFKAQPDCPQCHGAGTVYAGFTQCGCIRLADDTPAPRRENAAGAEPLRASPYALDELLTIIGVLKNALSTAEREREELQRDKERLDWLSDPAKGNVTIGLNAPPFIPECSLYLLGTYSSDPGEPFDAGSLREAIDRARGPSGGEEGR